jgi:CheY-like chemotaxis protein
MSSSPGKGSVFIISFPPILEAQLDPGAAAPAEAPPLAPKPQPRRRAAARATVVVVEDQPDQALFMRAVLQNHYEVALAANAGETFARLAELGARTGLILMDLSLAQGEDGLTLARRIRADRRWRELPIVITSAHAFAEDRERALAAGAAAYLAKPINAADLLATVERLLA